MRVLAWLSLMSVLACKGKPKAEAVDPTPVVVDVKPTWMQEPDANPAKNRVIIVAFEGVDPDWVERWRGELTNLDALLAGRVLSRLETTTPPSAPVTWSSFATGTNAGHHGVFGFVDRDPARYAPVAGTNDYVPTTFGPDGDIVSPAVAHKLRLGDAFWVTAAKAGKRVKGIFLPYDYPPDEVAGAQLLAGEGLPDLRLTTSTFFLLDSQIGPKAGVDVSGGELVPLTCTPDCTAVVEGPRGADGERARLRVGVGAPKEGQVGVELDGVSTNVRLGEFSDWLILDIPLSSKASVRARTRFYLVEAGERTRLYMHPLVADVAEPFLPVSAPREFARALSQSYGAFETLGWAQDTAALNSDLVPEEMFITQSREVFEERLNLALGELSRRDADLFIAAFSRPDRVAHMFMRLSDPSHPAYDDGLAVRYASALKESYLDMDRAVGELRKLLEPGDELIVFSEHGFQPFKREFNVNTWLLEQGYLKLAPGVVRGEDNAIGTADIDWKRSSAWSVGTGQIFLNIKGREAQGIVPAAKAADLSRQIAAKLVDLRDGKQKVVEHAFLSSEIYDGPALADAPDLVLALAQGYQTSRATNLGLVPTKVFEDNRKRWSGDHASSDAADTQGFVVSTLTNLPAKPDLLDIAPTALSLLGLAPGADMKGKVWSAAPAERAP